MSKLHAQMALLGTIDEVVRHASNGDTVKMVEGFLPGTTGIGQQGWYRELRHFLSKDELLPRDKDGNVVKRDGPVKFPTYAEAINELAAAPLAEELPAGPALKSKALFAATILSQAAELERKVRPRDANYVSPLDDAPDALEALMPIIAPGVRMSKAPTRDLGQSSTGDAMEDMKITLRTLGDRSKYLNYTRALANARDDELDAETRDVFNRDPVCNGALRKINGKFCTVLTTSWDTPFRLSQIAQIIDPHNWPKLCDFFVSMKDQDPIDPDRTRGWTRLLESVSGDKAQWQMQTALRFWNGVAPPGDGIFVNYDLDDPPRVKDCGLLEVDAGYIWATPISGTGPDPFVKIRTSKQVRIRGVSPTATAAMSCGFGWGDAMSQMFKSGVDAPPAGRIVFAPSTETAAAAASASQSAVQRPAGGGSDAQIRAAAEEVELLPGWRGAIIDAMAVQMTRGIDTAAELGVDFAAKWSDGDGFSLEDVKSFGGKFGTELTDYATGIFTEAAAALKPQPDDTARGGDDR